MSLNAIRFLANADPLKSRAVLGCAIAATCVVLVLILTIKKGTVRLKYGIVANGRDSPIEFWLGVAVVALAAALTMFGLCLSLADWLGWFDK
jgi:hypothetical protein